jgi:hypothetical protein
VTLCALARGGSSTEGNHNTIGKRSLEDPLGIIGHMLQQLGHKIVWEPANDRFLLADAGINILIEGFTPQATEIVKNAHNQGARFIIVATEEPHYRGFNAGRDLEMVKRQKEFPNAAKYCEGILYLVPGLHVHAWYNQWAPAAHVELGYAPTLVRPHDGQEPKFDFGFFGSLSRRRLKILRRLARHAGSEKAVRIESTFPDQVTRDRIMREARVIVQLRKHDEMGLVSSSRCNTALCLGRPVLAEPHAYAKPWDEVIKFSDSLESFMDDAILMRTAWKGVHAAQFANFREKFTPERCVGRALREIGLRLDTPIVVTTMPNAALAAKVSARARMKRLGLM